MFSPIFSFEGTFLPHGRGVLKQFSLFRSSLLLKSSFIYKQILNNNDVKGFFDILQFKFVDLFKTYLLSSTTLNYKEIEI